MDSEEYADLLSRSPLYYSGYQMQVAMNKEVTNLIKNLHFRSLDQFINWIQTQPTIPKSIPEDIYHTIKNLQVSSKIRCILPHS